MEWGANSTLFCNSLHFFFDRLAEKKHENDSSEFDVSVFFFYTYVYVIFYSKKMADVSKFSH